MGNWRVSIQKNSGSWRNLLLLFIYFIFKQTVTQRGKCKILIKIHTIIVVIPTLLTTEYTKILT